MGYDVKCFELAEAFLKDCCDPPPPRLVDLLAQDIQEVIEDFIDSNGPEIQVAAVDAMNKNGGE